MHAIKPALHESYPSLGSVNSGDNWQDYCQYARTKAYTRNNTNFPWLDSPGIQQDPSDREHEPDAGQHDTQRMDLPEQGY